MIVGVDILQEERSEGPNAAATQIIHTLLTSVIAKIEGDAFVRTVMRMARDIQALG